MMHNQVKHNNGSNWQYLGKCDKAANFTYQLIYKLKQRLQLKSVKITNYFYNFQITQISCFDTNLAPPGCTQYLYGSSGTGTINSFNYAGGTQLANQNQNICIR